MCLAKDIGVVAIGIQEVRCVFVDNLAVPVVNLRTLDVIGVTYATTPTATIDLLL